MNRRTYIGTPNTWPEGWGKNQIRKRFRRMLDGLNPERSLVRRRIRLGLYPRWTQRELKGLKPVWRDGVYSLERNGKTMRIRIRWPLLQSTFTALTQFETQAKLREWQRLHAGG